MNLLLHDKRSIESLGLRKDICKNIEKIVNKELCDVTTAYLCYKFGCQKVFKCKTRVSPLDNKLVYLCDYERKLFFNIIIYALKNRITVDMAVNLLREELGLVNNTNTLQEIAR